MNLVVLVTLLGACNGLYEDQLGQNDWNIKNIGMLSHSVLAQNYVFAASEEGVIGAVQIDASGEIVWRQDLEETISSLTTNGKQVLSVSNCVARIWAASTGTLMSERQVCQTNTMNILYSDFYPKTFNNLKNVALVGRKDGVQMWHDQTEVWNLNTELSGVGCSNSNCFAYHLNTDGSVDLFKLDGGNERWKIEDVGTNLVFTHFAAGVYLTYPISQGQFAVYDLESRETQVMTSLKGELSRYSNHMVKIGTKMYLTLKTLVPVWDDASETTMHRTETKGEVVHAFGIQQKRDLSKCGPIESLVWKIPSHGLEFKLDFPETSGRLGERGVLRDFSVQAAEKTSTGYRARILAQFEDGSLICIEFATDGGTEVRSKVAFIREESLAYVNQFGSIEFPFSASEKSSRVEEFADLYANGNPISILLFRLKDQIYSSRDYVLSMVQSTVDVATAVIESKGMLVVKAYKGELSQGYSDEQLESFGFRRGILLLSKLGKLFMIDSLTGTIVWSLYDATFAGNNSQMFVTRAHDAGLSHPAELMILDPSTGHAVWRNALSGSVIHEQIVNENIAASILIPVSALEAHSKEDDVSPASVLLALDSKNKLHVFPTWKRKDVLGDIALLKKLHLMDLDKNTIRGFSVKPEGIAELVWQHVVPSSHTFVGINSHAGGASNNPGLRLSDGSVMVKHNNPHLVLLATLDDKSDLVVSLIDGVSGRVTKRFQHKGCQPPFHSVVFDNMIVYSSWNDVAKRNEISSVGLYDGIIDKKSLNMWTSRMSTDIGAGETFSSFDLSNKAASSEQRTFYSDKAIRSFGVTSSRFGITDRNVLIAFENGNIAMQPRQFMDPRRPKGSKVKDPGLMEYFPQMPIVPTAIISYNLTIEKISKIYSMPTRLESTCLVLATGRDLFFTRVMPSKGFDLLNEDFNFSLLLVLIAGLTFLTGFLSKMVKEKNLKAAWV